MKKKLLKKLNMLQLAVILGTFVLVCAVSGSLAAFTNQGYRRGVATTRTQEVMFSSNLLQLFSVQSQTEGNMLPTGTNNSYETAWMTFPEDADSSGQTVQQSIYIYNHAKSNFTLINPKDIEYTLYFELHKVNDAPGVNPSDISISIYGDALQSVTFSNWDQQHPLTPDALTGGISGQTRLVVAMPYTAIGKFYITMVSAPKNYAVTGYQALAANLYSSTYTTSTDASFQWNASLFGIRATEADTTPYSAFNLEITGNGTGKASLTWDPAFVELDPHYIEKMGLTVTNITDNHVTVAKRVVFDLDSIKQDYYLLQFYRTQMQTSETAETVFKAGETYTEPQRPTQYIYFAAQETTEAEPG